MDKKMVSDLEQLGLTEGESKVYLALITIGSSSVGKIVKESGVAYSNIYEILNRLIEKGIASFIIKGKTKYFQPISPSNLLDYLDRKQKDIENQKKIATALLPQLSKLRTLHDMQEGEVFLGPKGLKTAYEKLLQDHAEGDEALFFYVHEEEYLKKSELFYAGIKGLLKKVSYRGISNEEYRSSKFVKIYHFFDMRFVTFPVPGNMDIFQDKVLIISWKPEIAAILIHSRSIAEHFRQYFNSVWKMGKK